MRRRAAAAAKVSVLVAAAALPFTLASCGDDDDDVAASSLETTVASASEPDDAMTSEPDDHAEGPGADGPVREPEYFGSARVVSAAYPDCETSVAGDDVMVEADGYLPGAEVIVSLQLVDGEPTVVSTASADADGAVSVPATLPNAEPGALGGFELIGDGPDGLLLNEALLVFGDADACDTDQ